MTLYDKGRPEAWAELDVAALKHNYHSVCKAVGEATVIPVVKDNFYGHGMKELAPILDAEGAELFAVGDVREGVELRACGVKADVVILTWYFEEEIEALFTHRLMPTVTSLEEAKALDAVALSRGDRLDVHVKVNTGMNRYGVHWEKAIDLLAAIHAMDGLNLRGVCSVLTGLEEQAPDQKQRFAELMEALAIENINPGVVHLLNSDGLLDHDESRYSAVRSGILLLGLYPNELMREADALGLRPVLTLKTRVAEVKSVKAGEGFGFFWRSRAETDTDFAVLTAGRRDGLSRGAAPFPYCLIGGARREMEKGFGERSAYAELGAPGSSGVRAGDEVVIMGRQGDGEIDAYEMATHEGISVYGLSCRHPERLPRVLINR